jgi:hypothetical protein
MPTLSDVTRVRLLDHLDAPLTDWHAVYNLNPMLMSNRLFQVDLAIAARNQDFGDIVTGRDPFSGMSLLVQRNENNSYYLFKNCIFQQFNSLDLAQNVWYSEVVFLCEWYEAHVGQRIQIIRPIRSQQSRPPANLDDTQIRNRLRNLGVDPDCGRDSDGPVDWLNNGF